MNSSSGTQGFNGNYSKGFRSELGEYQVAVDSRLEEMEEQRAVGRIWDCDHTLWKNRSDDITNRLGWLTISEKMTEEIGEIESFVDDLKKNGFTYALLLGMGGSSLAPEVFRSTFGVEKGYLDLSILDSTDPDAVLEFSEKLDFSTTLFIVSTKSGGTIETLSFMKYFYTKAVEKMGDDRAGEHFVAITDPGSSLVKTAEELRFRKIFLNDPNIGGRYSALSFFGLVPAAMVGVDISVLLKRASEMASECREEKQMVKGKNPGAILGAIAGELGKMGRNKLTLILSPSISSLGSWIEQLIAESTGKDGKGIIPVNGESLLPPEGYGKDRLFVNIRLMGEGRYDERVREIIHAGHPAVEIRLNDIYDLGAEFFRWEMATSIAGHILEINPFDQPNVESSKVMSKQMLDFYRDNGSLPETAPVYSSDDVEIYWDEDVDSIKEALLRFLSYTDAGEESGKGRSYIAIHAYLKPTGEADRSIHSLRTEIQRLTGMATTMGYGPRFLHSTGQLHKGDNGKGLFIQMTSGVSSDVDIPDKAGERASFVSFGVLKMAQALGDARALIEGNRKVIRFHIVRNISSGLNQIKSALK
jgi:glucose-6-phosphate isomerase